MEGFKHIIRLLSLSVGDWIGGLFHVAQWGYGESVTEESDGVLDLVDSCLEVRGDLVVTKQFFRDNTILQLRHQVCGDTL